MRTTPERSLMLVLPKHRLVHGAINPMPTTLTELGSDHHSRRNQRARLFEGPDADETTVSYISDGMVIVEHLSARTGDIIRT